MLPAPIFHLLWLLLAIGVPLVQSLHALQTKAPERKLWLFYWLCYATGSCILYWFEWLIRLPFWALSFFVDAYYEAQLLLVCFLVLPRFGGIKRLQVVVVSKSRHLSNQACSLVGKKLQTSLNPASAKPKDRPGTYIVIKAAGIMPTLATVKGHLVGRLTVGDSIEVLEVVEVKDEKRVRARIKTKEAADGWISLVNQESGTRWAVHAEDYANMPCPSSVPMGSEVFANAAAAGCNPMALLQGVSAVQPGALEVSDEVAWEAMAMLESQVARADDLSEDPGTRQASQILRTMLTAIAKSGDTAMLSMAQAMMPDLGKIWANPSTREYLKDLLSSPAAGEGCSSSSSTGAASSTSGGASGSSSGGGCGTSASAGT